MSILLHLVQSSYEVCMTDDHWTIHFLLFLQYNTKSTLLFSLIIEYTGDGTF